MFTIENLKACPKGLPLSNLKKKLSEENQREWCTRVALWIHSNVKLEVVKKNITFIRTFVCLLYERMSSMVESDLMSDVIHIQSCQYWSEKF